MLARLPVRHILKRRTAAGQRCDTANRDGRETEVWDQPWTESTNQDVLTGPQVARARQVAADAGMTVEARDHHQTRLAATRSGATAAGLLLALGILARTVG